MLFCGGILHNNMVKLVMWVFAFWALIGNILVIVFHINFHKQKSTWNVYSEFE